MRGSSQEQRVTSRGGINGGLDVRIHLICAEVCHITSVRNAREQGKKSGEKQAELNRQRNEYQNLFERVPCIITVQDRNYKLIRYNKEFYEKY